MDTAVSWLTLLTFNLSSKFHFTVALDAWLPVVIYVFALLLRRVVQFGEGAVHVRCRRKESSRSLSQSHLLMSFLLTSFFAPD